MNLDIKKIKNNGISSGILLATLLIGRKGLEWIGDQAGPAVAQYLPWGFTGLGLLAQLSKNDLVGKFGQAATVVGLEAGIRSAITDPSTGAVKDNQAAQVIAKALPRSSGLGNVPMLPPMSQYSTAAMPNTESAAGDFLNGIGEVSSWI